MPRNFLCTFAVVCLVSGAFTGCGPKADFQSYDQKRLPKPLDAPIGIYPSGYVLPANAHVIGWIEIGAGLLPGKGELEDSFEKAKEKAREVGGDAVQVTELSMPMDPGDCWGLKGYVFTLEPPFDFTRIAIAEDTIRTHIDSLPNDSTSIAGIWRVDEAQVWRSGTRVSNVMRKDELYRLALLPSEDSTYDYEGVVLFANDPGWSKGFVKTRLKRTGESQVFVGQWYHSDFSKVTVQVTRDKSVHMGFTIKGAVGAETVEHKVTLYRLHPSL